MAKTGEIGGSGGINPEGGGRNVFYVYKQVKGKSQDKVKKLHPGEIILGTVIEVYSRDEISVRLPVGTFRSEIKGRLIKGDTLFFKVKEVEPYLVLITFAVAVKHGNYELNSKDVLRILDIPDNVLFNSISEFLILKKSILKRDEILEFYDNYLTIPEKDRVGKSSEDIFFTIFMFKLSHLQFDIINFKKYFSLFTGFNDFYSNLINLWNYARKAEVRLKVAFSNILSFFESDVSSIFDSSKAFMIEEKSMEAYAVGLETQVRFSLHSEIKNLLSGDRLSEIADTGNYLLRYLETKNNWNNSAGSAYIKYLLFKLNIESNFHLIEIIIQKYNILPQEEKLRFQFGQTKESVMGTQNDMNERGISRASFYLTRADSDNKMKLDDYFNRIKGNHETDTRFNDFINDLVKYLHNNNMSIRAIQSTFFQEREFYPTYDMPGEQTTGLSVAI